MTDDPNKPYLAWLYGNLDIIVPAVAGVLIGVASQEDHSLRTTLIRFVTGVLAATLFTDPTLDYIERDPAVYKEAVAGLWGITGYAMSKFLTNLKLKHLREIVAIVRGKS